MLGPQGRFCQTAAVRNGRVQLGETVQSVYLDQEFVVEAIYQQLDRRTGSCTFLCGPQGTRPIPALTCDRKGRATRNSGGGGRGA